MKSPGFRAVRAGDKDRPLSPVAMWGAALYLDL
jgi:hypothetical protein